MNISNGFKTCHHLPTLIYYDKNSKIEYFSADQEGADSFDGDLILNLTKLPGTKASATTYNIPQLAKHMADLPEEIVLGWEDFEMPPVKYTFWKAFHNYCKSKNYHKVCLRCVHGHGRTGTAVAAMKIANLAMDAESAIISIRNDYCPQAVESDKQIIYLFSLDSALNGVEFPDDDQLNNIINNFYVKPRVFSTRILYEKPY